VDLVIAIGNQFVDIFNRLLPGKIQAEMEIYQETTDSANLKS
jgi:hypothetical protein